MKWTLQSISVNKASGSDGIPVELFQILKGDAVKVLHSICKQIWKTQQWPQDWKRSVFVPIPKKGNSKECSNYCTIALISHASKVMLKILQARLQQYVNFQMFMLDFEKAEEPEIKLPTSVGSSKRQESSRKISTSALLTMPKPCVDHNKLENSSRDGNTTPPDLPPEKSVCRPGSNRTGHGTTTDSKLGKEHVKAVYCHPACLTYMQSTSCEMPGCMKHKLKSRLPGEISITSDMQMTPSYGRK